MKTTLNRRLAPVAFVLILSTLACIFNTRAPTSGPSNPSNPSGGPGEQNLSDPAAGMLDLKSYQAELTLSFAGTQDGNPSEWTTVYTLDVEPAAGTRLLSITSTGLPAESSLDGWIAGSYAGMLIEKGGHGSPCAARKSDGSPVDLKFEPAQLLPPVTGAVDAGTENIQGLNASHFTFGQAAVGFPGKGTVTGEMWLAGGSNYLLGYTLSAEGGPDLFEQELQGTMTWRYQLNQIDQPIRVDLPEDCPPGLIDAPLMEGAQVLVDQPGLQEFNIETDLKGVESFYQEKLPALGYTLQAEPVPDMSSETLAFFKQGWQLNVLVETLAESSSHVLVSLERSENNGQPATPAPTATLSPQVDLAKRLGEALSLLSTSSDKPSPLGSFHLEVTESLPGLNKTSGKVEVSNVQISADVEGSNYYFQHIQDGRTVSDGYMIDGQEYDLKNGQTSPGMGLIDVDWISWSLDILMPYGIATLGPTPAGQEALDGRTADVFELDSTRADPAALSALQSMNFFSDMTITSASGKVWLDQQTGAMLKLNLTYTGEIKDTQGASLGTGTGQVDLSVTQVGAVSVKLP